MHPSVKHSRLRPRQQHDDGEIDDGKGGAVTRAKEIEALGIETVQQDIRGEVRTALREHRTMSNTSKARFAMRISTNIVTGPSMGSVTVRSRSSNPSAPSMAAAS